MNSNKAKKRQRDLLFKRQKGLCCWCRRPMRKSWTHKQGVPVPDDLATIEHLDSRLNPERGQHPGERRHRLACAKCNHQRGAEEDKRLSLDERRQLSGRG